MTEKRFVIIAGPFGGGKTRLFLDNLLPNDFEKAFPENFINPEVYYHSLREHYDLPEHYTRAGRGERTPDFLSRANERAQTERFRLLVKGRSFATEFALDSVEDLDVIQAARHHNYHITLFFVGTDNWKRCVQRIRREHNHWHHHYTDADIAACYHRSLSFLPSAIPLINDGYVLENSNAGAPVKLLSIKKGRIELTMVTPPDWLTDPIRRCL